MVDNTAQQCCCPFVISFKKAVTAVINGGYNGFVAGCSGKFTDRLSYDYERHYTTTCYQLIATPSLASRAKLLIYLELASLRVAFIA